MKLFTPVFTLALLIPTFAQGYEVIANKDWVTASDVVAFQPFSEQKGDLINLNHFINRWYLLKVGSGWLNLENPYPNSQLLELNEKGELILRTKKGAENCGNVAASLASKDPYVGICGGRIEVRTRQNGRSDKINWADLDVASLFSNTDAAGSQNSTPPPDAVQAVAKLGETGNGFAINGAAKGMQAGQWYEASHFKGVYISATRANGNVVNLMAMDLSQFTYGWNNGTTDPGVGWSSRAKSTGGAGPDGFGNLSPLVFPGVVDPVNAARTIGVMTGGFKRHHSAFRMGPFHDINRSSHYGFMEKGVLMSTIIPNLATFIIYANGKVDLKTWSVADEKDLSQMSDIRQNGVPIIEDGAINPLVNSWGGGNWSGSGDAKLLTPRTAACLVESAGKRFLVMTYFSLHTPPQMASVLMAYNCKYAIHLDMNQPVFSYSAFFTPNGDGSFTIEHLNKAMATDTTVNGKLTPRFLLAPTYRDFFYIMRK